MARYHVFLSPKLEIVNIDDGGDDDDHGDGDDHNNDGDGDNGDAEPVPTTSRNHLPCVETVPVVDIRKYRLNRVELV